jgi:AbrB family looped-hinge helix DNA binding protein
MSDNYIAKVGNKGRIVIPAGLRERKGWTDETVLVFIEEDDDILLMSFDDLERRVHAEWKGSFTLEEFLAERRETARLEDEETERSVAKVGVAGI